MIFLHVDTTNWQANVTKISYTMNHPQFVHICLSALPWTQCKDYEKQKLYTNYDKTILVKVTNAL